MSADNWRVCPRCELNRVKQADKAAADAAKAYGKVPLVEYKRMEQKAAGIRDRNLDARFREDYDQGVGVTGVYSVSYHGSCQECGLEFSYKYETMVPGLGDPPNKD